MILSFEDYLLVNGAVTAALLALSVRQAGVIRPRRLLTVSAASACAAALIEAGQLPRSLALALMPLSVFAVTGGRQWLTALGWCAVWSGAFAGGLALAQPHLARFGLWRAPLLMAPFFAAAWRLERGTRTFVPRLRLRIVTAGGTAEVSALVDSGNRLLEPFSGLPVLIVGSDSLNDVLGAPLLAEAAPLPSGFRVVCYRALGGGGQMRCFRPDAVRRFRRGRWIDAPAMWVGIYPGRIPGGAEALAPLCCAAEE